MRTWVVKCIHKRKIERLFRTVSSWPSGKMCTPLTPSPSNSEEVPVIALTLFRRYGRDGKVGSYRQRLDSTDRDCHRRSSPRWTHRLNPRQRGLFTTKTTLDSVTGGLTMWSRRLRQTETVSQDCRGPRTGGSDVWSGVRVRCRGSTGGPEDTVTNGAL